MVKKFLFSLLLCLVLALPAYTTTTPAADPLPVKGKTSSPKGPQEQVLVIRTAKDPKVNQIKVGEKGEVLIPQSTAIAGAAIAGAAAGGASGGAASPGPGAADAGAPKGAETGDEALSGGDSKKAEDGGGLKGASGSSGSGDNKTSSNLSSFMGGSLDGGGGILGGGAASGFNTNPDLIGNLGGGGGGNQTFTLTAFAGTHGAISPSGLVFVNAGASQSFTITPDSGFSVADVLVDGASVGALTSFTFSNVNTFHTIVASFALPTITASVGANGAISPAGSRVL